MLNRSQADKRQSPRDHKICLYKLRRKEYTFDKGETLIMGRMFKLNRSILQDPGDMNFGHSLHILMDSPWSCRKKRICWNIWVSRCQFWSRSFRLMKIFRYRFIRVMNMPKSMNTTLAKRNAGIFWKPKKALSWSLESRKVSTAKKWLRFSKKENWKMWLNISR